MTIRDNLQRVQERIANAAARAGRPIDDVTLVAVSKTHPPAALLEAVDAGVQHFGENRVEEAESKIPAVMRANKQMTDAPLIWHMIGHVQSRKAKQIVPLFQVVHSLDSVKLAERLSRLAAEEGRTVDVLLEVNVSGEASKEGLFAACWETDTAVREALWTSVGQIVALPNLHVRGLMTMAPIVPEPEDARPVFVQLAALRSALSESLNVTLPDLSMGMTDDFEVAIEEGSTMVRIGRAIFGERHH